MAKLARCIAIVCLLYAAITGAQTVTVSAGITIPAYRAHLVALQSIVADCARQPSPETCAPARVGSDDDVLTLGVTRRVSYDWLRHALSEAAQADKSKAYRTATLRAASDRLRDEVASAAEPIAQAPPTTAARARLNKILASGEFVHVHQESLLASFWRRFLEWLFRSLGAASASASGQWLGRAFWLALLALGLGGLLWWFQRQLVRQGLAVRDPAPNRTAPGILVEWQTWLDEAQRLADRGAWREAVHAVYWAAAARLAEEFRWPRDQTRTPRESLRLLDPATPRSEPFAQLTRSFERTWYGHRLASAEDFARARTLFEQLSA